MHANLPQTGQASRIARSCKLDNEWHLYEPDGQNHVQKLWWTVCALDQRQSAVVGAVPDYLSQEQINRNLSEDNNPGNAFSLPLRVNLCLANLLTRVMTGKCTHLLSEQSNTRVVLSRHRSAASMSHSIMNEIEPEIQELHRLAQEIRNAQPLCYERSLSTISRPIASLHLLYCHVSTKY